MLLNREEIRLSQISEEANDDFLRAVIRKAQELRQNFEIFEPFSPEAFQKGSTTGGLARATAQPIPRISLKLPPPIIDEDATLFHLEVDDTVFFNEESER